MNLNICHLYPDLLDLYGDRGNILALSARSCWRGIETVVQRASLGDKLDFHNIDILFIGGGSNREQNLLVQDLMRRKTDLQAAIEDGLVMLTICEGYQLLGQYYQTAEGKKIPGLGILDLWTIAGPKRMIGNVVVETPLGTLVGFENHSGKTYLGSGLESLGKVLVGYGNNGQDKTEGVRCKNIFGTYLHGPLLPKNPDFADLLLQLALKRRGYIEQLGLLDDNIERLAHQAMLKKLIKN
ncbi:MAG: glutamine amidotransferase [Desulfitobacteriaceae bacterium]|nr:glutamine amidotransferase [Desulfitobacteriaceae bacterium]MDD4345451.1 glutamine amidotransferase [Desulfitobacteriaceae bacterium]MDD4400702.1 glutamine amidotransferase [Desulfitobacteriaceae bacterium]